MTTEIKKETEFHVGVDVTRSVWVFVTAEDEQQAEEFAKEKAFQKSEDGAGAWVASDVHSIHEEI